MGTVYGNYRVIVSGRNSKRVIGVSRDRWIEPRTREDSRESSTRGKTERIGMYSRN